MRPETESRNSGDQKLRNHEMRGSVPCIVHKVNLNESIVWVKENWNVLTNWSIISTELAL